MQWRDSARTILWRLHGIARGGYQLNYQAQGAPTPNTYLTTAVPVAVGQTGQTSYCSDEPGIIHYDSTGLQAASPVAWTALPLVLADQQKNRLNAKRTMR